MANLDKIRHCVIFYFMANTLNISLTAEQKEWLRSRRESGGFASASDVVRDLIRTRQEQEQAQLLEPLSKGWPSLPRQSGGWCPTIERREEIANRRGGG